jgi:hypothetical protein
MDALLGGTPAPRLFLEFMGQGDSDRPRGYRYSTAERTDLVEATWRAEGIASTSVVAFDHGSLPVLEILARQLDRERAGLSIGTRVDTVVIVNGGLFVDGHSHPVLTTPLLASPVGAMAMWAGQRSRAAFLAVLRSARLWSRDFHVSRSGAGRPDVSGRAPHDERASRPARRLRQTGARPRHARQGRRPCRAAGRCGVSAADVELLRARAAAFRAEVVVGATMVPPGHVCNHNIPEPSGPARGSPSPPPSPDRPWVALVEEPGRHGRAAAVLTSS